MQAAAILAVAVLALASCGESERGRTPATTSGRGQESRREASRRATSQEQEPRASSKPDLAGSGKAENREREKATGQTSSPVPQTVGRDAHEGEAYKKSTLVYYYMPG